MKITNRLGIHLMLLGIAAWATCGTSYAQQLIGSPGAGWQNWTAATDAFGNFIDLNNNNAPFWDVPFLAFGQYSGTNASKNVGFCLTSTGDCQGIGSALIAPGALPFWGMPYNSVADTGGGLDKVVFFKTSAGQSYKATLYLNIATNTVEINEFGWFEVTFNNWGAPTAGTRHVLFQGSGFPPGTQTPDPVGKTVTFTPTRFFGYYYSDVSDPEFNNGPPHGCLAFTLFNSNDPDCTAAHGQGDHVFAIFKVTPSDPTFWVAGQDPSGCTEDGDCNLTVVKVSPKGDD